jgi:small subunit ribosomal protein S6
MLRGYECMLILPAEADEATVGTAVERISKVITPEGGTVDSIDRWGRKRFAFEIDRQHEGYYVVVRFEAEPSVQAELDRVLKLADEVVRHKVLLMPEKKPDKKKDATAPSPASVEA